MKHSNNHLNLFRDPSPCLNCTERFTACHDRCPKDIRGERGHKAWKADMEQIKQERKDYLQKRSEDMRRGDY